MKMPFSNNSVGLAEPGGGPGTAPNRPSQSDGGRTGRAGHGVQPSSSSRPAERVSPGRKNPAGKAAGAGYASDGRAAEQGHGPRTSASSRGSFEPRFETRGEPRGTGRAGSSVTSLLSKPTMDQLLNYNLMEVLGKGAGSTIYRARDTDTGRIVAVKHVSRLKQKDIRYVEQMETEYEVSKSFSHPNLRRAFLLKVNKSLLLKVVDAVLVLEYVDARPLERSLPSELDAVISSFIQAAEGLQAMHRMGWAHCDIKPNNILRDTEGNVKVIDFGQACRIGTIKERIQGTPDYIAPEQVTRQPIAESTDVFNLGATLYWATTGKHVPTAYHAKRGGENSFLVDSMFKTPRDLNPEVPVPISDVVMQCVATSMKNRPQNMEEVIRKLELGRHIMRRDAQENGRD